MAQMTATLVLLAVTSLIYIGCGDREFESDVKALVDLQCKSLQIASRVAAGDAAAFSEAAKVAADTLPVFERLKTKYASDSDREAFGQALVKGLAGCQK